MSENYFNGVECFVSAFVSTEGWFLLLDRKKKMTGITSLRGWKQRTKQMLGLIKGPRTPNSSTEQQSMLLYY